jgi:Zn-dependent peptidase ImmA (M78 family)
MRRVLRDAGVHVAFVPFQDPDVDAASVTGLESAPVILMNTRGRGVRSIGGQRAALAHELCHILHDRLGATGSRILVSRLASPNEDAEFVEQRARAFAPAFLAPKAAVRQWAKTCGHAIETPIADADEAVRLVVSLAEHWGLSYEGGVWHAKNCKLVHALTAADIAQAPPVAPFSPAFDEGLEPESEVSPLWRGLAEEIVLRAREEGRITEGRSDELLASPMA